MADLNTTTPRGDILIVDDDPFSLRLLAQILKGRGYKVRPVTEGPRALEAAQSTPPDLVLLDINMPGMNGYEVCSELKANERTARIPIIFISGLDATTDKVRAFAAGGVDYVTKPFHEEEVLARVDTHVTLWTLQRDLREKNAQIQAAMDELKVLRGILPICASCKKVRDDEGYWHDVAVYLLDHSEAVVSHSLCPQCATKLYPDLF